MQFNDTLEMIDEVSDMIERHVQGMRRVKADELGLDYRCGRAYVDSECIIVDDANVRSFDYYGGFEYIKGEDRVNLGNYVVYLNTSDRVNDALECLMEKDGLCESKE